MNLRHILLVVILAVLMPAPGRAQSPETQPAGQSPALARPEVFVSLAWADVFRLEDRSFGRGPNLGAGILVPVWRRLHLQVEANRVIGLSPTPVPCAAISPGPGQPSLPCGGTTREGVSGATFASVAATYFFATSRVRPFVTGGVGLLRSTGVSSTSHVGEGEVTGVEQAWTDTGVGATVGGGLEVAVGSRFSVRPEFRYYDATALSDRNLQQVRVSTAVGYRW